MILKYSDEPVIVNLTYFVYQKPSSSFFTVALAAQTIKSDSFCLFFVMFWHYLMQRWLFKIRLHNRYGAYTVFGKMTTSQTEDFTLTWVFKAVHLSSKAGIAFPTFSGSDELRRLCIAVLFRWTIFLCECTSLTLWNTVQNFFFFVCWYLLFVNALT